MNKFTLLAPAALFACVLSRNGSAAYWTVGASHGRPEQTSDMGSSSQIFQYDYDAVLNQTGGDTNWGVNLPIGTSAASYYVYATFGTKVISGATALGSQAWACATTSNGGLYGSCTSPLPSGGQVTDAKVSLTGGSPISVPTDGGLMVIFALEGRNDNHLQGRADSVEWSTSP